MGIEEFEVIRNPAPVADAAVAEGAARRRIEAANASEPDASQRDASELKAQLARLRQEHRDFDVAIEALHNAPGTDLLQVQRLKKRKLQLRDRIILIEDQLTPDIIA